MSAPIFAEGIIKRTRHRRSRMSIDRRQEIVDRVLKFAEDDIDNRVEDRERRLQRYAKYRMWTENREGPWGGSSDIPLSDITEAVLNLEDTLSNAILANRPVVNANALKRENDDKASPIDRVLDSQFFVEQEGEKIVEELAESFLVDGVFTAYTPWIREKRPVTDLRIFDPIPPDANPITYFEQLLQQEFQGEDFFRDKDEEWNYRVELKDPLMPTIKVRFYTRKSDDFVEMLIHRMTEVYDGPRTIVKDYNDVLTPPRVANLQPPSPKNPGGSPHVILVDYPRVDELENLKREGFYDLANSDEGEDKNELGMRSRDTSRDEANQQKDVIQGVQDEDRPTDPKHRSLTRYMCFDVFDLDDDGIAEDVIFWVLKEDKVLLKAMPLTEMFPSDPPRRPLAEAAFLPIKGRREGMSLIELMEGLHDFLKETLDMGMDGGSLAGSPFFFYRSGSSLKPETLRLGPGDGVPVSDPQRDIHFPQIPFDGSFFFNAYSIGRQLEERLTLEGDLQSGRVPAGKSSALRTVGGINTILAQGEARPERVLRRFFMGFAEIYKQMHELNQHFFPEEKEIRVLGIIDPGEDPYPKIVRQSDLDGRYVFDFRASMLNSSKLAQQQGLDRLLALLVNPLMIQLGIVGPDEIFRLVRDSAKVVGVDPNRYLKEPTPGAGRTRITANQAISVIFDHMIPDGVPAEPSAQDHLDQLQGFMKDERFGLLDEAQTKAFGSWLKQVMQLAISEEGQQKVAELTEGFQQKMAGAGGGNGAAAPVNDGGTQVNQNELLDETLSNQGEVKQG